MPSLNNQIIGIVGFGRFGKVLYRLLKKDFEDLSIENQKRFLLECLDKNHLYVNYSEIDNEECGVSERHKRLNREFYKK